MLKLLVISVSNKQTPALLELINNYQKRLKGDISWQLINHGEGELPAAKRREADALLKIIRPDDYVVLLDETGRELTSQGLADQLTGWEELGRRIVVVIGGAYGVDESVKLRADFIWSLSQLVFPHQLVQLILTEQLYRAQTIRDGHPYHHK